MIYLKPKKKPMIFDKWVYNNLKEYGNTIILKDTLKQLGISIEYAKDDIKSHLNLNNDQDIWIYDSKETITSSKVKEHYIVEVVLK